MTSRAGQGECDERQQQMEWGLHTKKGRRARHFCNGNLSFGLLHVKQKQQRGRNRSTFGDECNLHEKKFLLFPALFLNESLRNRREGTLEWDAADDYRS